MKTKVKYIALTLLIGFSYGCFEDNDDNATGSGSIKDFVWKAMNSVYLYNADVPDLSDDRFITDSDYNSFLDGYSSPETLFESLVYDRENVDRFSIITNNYFELEQSLSGINKRSGAEFNFYLVPGSSTEVFGIVRLILPNSNASQTSLTRGQVFNKVNGTTMTISNYRSLFSSDTYTINLANYDDNNTDDISDDSISDTADAITLIKSIYTENPVYKTEIFNLNNKKIGYLMYNGFVGEFDSELNNAFGTFKAENIDHLILDLRYNPGGSVRTATALGSMITGGFNNQVFATLKYNEDLQNNNYDYVFTDELTNGTAINSLNLDKVYVLTSGASASASEMIINSLKSYITVVQIGSTTVGKSQASQIIYDSSNFGRANANPTHTYALLPLIAITVNKDNIVVPSYGLVPDIEFKEKAANYGILGDPTEPLLEAALNEIQISGRYSNLESNNSDEITILNALDSKSTLMIAD
ncbi:MAG: S41 family peptidase [Bacteroidetes bacterium]|nr:S41 family peptidase [Bacteroidota bacterium]MDA0859374.1 S41 family peptidase [Bacteroidota bacterium]MDA1318039.1 S41 family peptidase [Bacteroidota bacterium]